MKTFWQNNKKIIIAGVLFLAVGLLLGKVLFNGSKSNSKETVATEEQEHTIYTCSMHPQVRQDHPGQCPICGMELIPLAEMSEDAPGPNEVELSNAAAKLADIQTVTVGASNPVKTVTLPGKVTADERNIAQLTARFPGRIEKLFVNFTGQVVRKGDKLATIYSPELVTAQKELVEALKFKSTNPEYYQAARNKLKLWSLSESQIDQLEQSGTVTFYVDVESPVTGTVTKRDVALGDYVKEGMMLFEVVDLSKVWVLFDAFEKDLPWLREGDHINFTVQAIPGEQFTSRIKFIDPLIDPQSRVAKVRAEVNNPSGKLKPEMFARGIVKSPLPGNGNVLTIPKSAVLWTGENSIVYVRDTTKKSPTFQYREVQLGADAGDSYVVQAGLQAGEVIAANGVFRIDAAAQLSGKRSMMNPEGGKVRTGHQHETMDNESDTKEMNDEGKGVPPQFLDLLVPVVEKYLSLKEALAADDKGRATAEAGQFTTALEKPDMTLLSNKAHSIWMEAKKPLSEAGSAIAKGGPLDQQREYFRILSNTLINILQAFNYRPKAGQELYIQYCPMVNEGKDGYWISEQKEIRNPYFGESMLTCGSTEQKID